MTNGQTLKRAREQAKVTLRELARRLRIDVGYLSRVENDDEKPSPRVLEGYAEAFGLDLDELHRLNGSVPTDVLTWVKGSPNALAKVRRAMAGASRDEDVDEDVERLAQLVEHDDVKDEEREAFADMLDTLASGKRTSLTAKQRQWIDRVRLRVGLDGQDSANLFSHLSPDQQAEQKRRAASVVLPWDREGHRRPLKPPGR